MSLNDTLIFTSISDICSLPGLTGSCKQLIGRYYHDNGTCKYFTYSGCGGNSNNFDTLKLCQETCLDIIPDSNEGAFNSYHIAGFIMIFVVICIFGLLYYLSIRGKKTYDPHQHRLIIKDDDRNKWNKPQCLFISNIAKKAIKSDIKALFSDYGKIIQFEFKETRGDQLNICFVQFESSDDAKRAMGELNGQQIEDKKLIIKPGSEYNSNDNTQKKPIITTISKTEEKQKEIITEKKNESDSDEIEQENNIETEQEKAAKRAKRLKERERRRSERKIRDKLQKEVATKKEMEKKEESMEYNDNDNDNNNNNDDDDEEEEDEDEDEEDEERAVMIDDDGKHIDMDSVDIDAIISNKNVFISQNPMTPTAGDDDEEEEEDEDKDKQSSSISMHQIDSDFQDYGDNEDHNERVNVSDSDQINFGDNHQISALRQFVDKKLTMDDDDGDIDAEYDWNDKNKGDTNNQYIGIAIEED